MDTSYGSLGRGGGPRGVCNPLPHPLVTHYYLLSPTLRLTKAKAPTLVLLLLPTAQTRSRMTSDLEIHAYGARIKSDYFLALEYMFDPVAFPPHRPCLNGRTILPSIVPIGRIDQREEPLLEREDEEGACWTDVPSKRVFCSYFLDFQTVSASIFIVRMTS